MRKYVLLEIGNLTNVVDTRKHGRCFEFAYIEEKIKKPLELSDSEAKRIHRLFNTH